ncbi:Coiled-coil domain-containing protein 19, mitochondrial [Tritrichomonas foetus]|uniref:Cilia- and flagella-associated protein 45 n=1 Tax=Tritrichomonas foetus TaxID=1144522 RepID=A0A1J4KIT9_9EUKA|nr:Coiled-coil domain-containing protein 19, mitochondrial [Tritrichomonas foetus]|eukprot:OHT09740.1 Coiled-coil domain-containing protein 19, mitochondrial [Tritrichomonas foetus]
METISKIQTKRQSLIAPEVTQRTLLNTKTRLSQVEERDYALRIADQKANEDLDEVKHINSQMVAAEARTIRDRQLTENIEIARKKKEEEEEWARKLEANRQTALRLYDEREATLREQRIRGRAIIKAQIEEHKINAILEAERIDREMKALNAQNALIAEEDRRILMEKKKRQQDFLHDCIQANEAQKRRKLEAREREKEEAQMVIEVAAQKALAEEAREKEKAIEHALKEREIEELRKKQKRAIDTQAIRDEKAATKVQKEKEEKDRLREERDIAKKIAMIEDVKKGRAEMIDLKKTRLIEQKKIEDAEYQRVVEANRIAREKALAAYKKKLEEDAKYRGELKVDMENQLQARKIDPAKKWAEAAKQKEENDAYLARLETIRQQKLNQLRAKGVPEKYLVDIMADKWEIK